MIVPLGPKDGAGFANMPLLGDTTLPTFMVSAAKGKTLLTPMLFERFLNPVNALTG